MDIWLIISILLNFILFIIICILLYKLYKNKIITNQIIFDFAKYINNDPNVKIKINKLI